MDPLLAASAITWTPVTFYVASGIVNAILVLVAFRMLHVDVEHHLAPVFIDTDGIAVPANVVARLEYRQLRPAV